MTRISLLHSNLRSSPYANPVSILSVTVAFMESLQKLRQKTPKLHSERNKIK